MQMMGSGATSTVLLDTLTATASSTMDMMASSTSPTSAMDSMSSTTSSSSMSMTMYLMTSYLNTPVIFEKLYATNKATCFAIFVVLFCTGFAFRGMAFLNTYIEQRIFRDERRNIEDIKIQVEKDLNSKVIGDSSTDQESYEVLSLRKLQSAHGTFNETQRSILAKFLSHTTQSLYQDFIRLLLTFSQVMVAYALMLAVMTCVLPYFFAVCLGIAFGEIFFLRLGHCYGLHPSHINGSLH
ncbi:hypothetical protein WICPIJ_000190 [Wickerhamomyces pijperi]|uniref:Copper transport protein n=1 Tax=Wickerhamomyces pijperi TaxID=599730 RepID=A0A9P8QH42_WICPI|nr:hypothetical protein WICPIJ_000190 [Wickerhamomyces pijperi]